MNHSELVVCLPDGPESISKLNGRAVAVCESVARARAALEALAGDCHESLKALSERAMKSRLALHEGCQAIVALAAERTELLRGLESHVRAAVASTEAELEKSRKAVLKTLEKAGLTAATLPGAGDNPVGAKAKIASMVETSEQVRADRAAAENAVENLRAWQSALREAPFVAERARAELVAVTRQLLRI